MVNPIVSAYNFILNLFQMIPAPIMYLAVLAISLSTIAFIVGLIFRG